MSVSEDCIGNVMEPENDLPPAFWRRCLIKKKYITSVQICRTFVCNSLQFYTCLLPTGVVCEKKIVAKQRLQVIILWLKTNTHFRHFFIWKSDISVCSVPSELKPLVQKWCNPWTFFELLHSPPVYHHASYNKLYAAIF